MYLFNLFALFSFLSFYGRSLSVCFERIVRIESFI
jgi:hypothetical protein